MIVTEMNNKIDSLIFKSINRDVNIDLNIGEKYVWVPSIELNFINKGIYSSNIADSIYEIDYKEKRTYNKIRLLSNSKITNLKNIDIISIDFDSFFIEDDGNSIVDKLLDLNENNKNIILDLTLLDLSNPKSFIDMLNNMDRYIKGKWSILGVIINSSIYLKTYKYLINNNLYSSIPNLMIINDIMDIKLYEEDLDYINTIKNKLNHKLVILLGSRNNINYIIDVINNNNNKVITYKDIKNGVINIIDNTLLERSYIIDLDNFDMIIVNDIIDIRLNDEVFFLKTKNSINEFRISNKLIIFEKDNSISNVCKLKTYGKFRYISYKDYSDIMYILLTKLKFIT